MRNRKGILTAVLILRSSLRTAAGAFLLTLILFIILGFLLVRSAHGIPAAAAAIWLIILWEYFAACWLILWFAGEIGLLIRRRATVQLWPACIALAIPLLLGSAYFKTWPVSVSAVGRLAAAPWTTPKGADIQSRARTAKAQQDTRAIASALTQYSAHCGDLPGQAGDRCVPGGAGMPALTVVQTNDHGHTAGPWFANPGPVPPDGWCPAAPCTAADYVIDIPGPKGPGTFQVVATPRSGENGSVALTAP